MLGLRGRRPSDRRDRRDRPRIAVDGQRGFVVCSTIASGKERPWHRSSLHRSGRAVPAALGRHPPASRRIALARCRSWSSRWPLVLDLPPALVSGKPRRSWTPGRVIRSAQPTSQLPGWIRDYRLRSILNLRGGSSADWWYEAEVEGRRPTAWRSTTSPSARPAARRARELLILIDTLEILPLSAADPLQERGRPHRARLGPVPDGPARRAARAGRASLLARIRPCPPGRAGAPARAP